MRTFLEELRTTHRARVGELLHRHKSAIGYALLTTGVIIALALAGKAILEVGQRTEHQAAVICQNTIRADRTSLTNLYTKSGHELLATFHLTIPQARKLIHKQLVASAAERVALQPSDPRSACTGKLTTLSPAELRKTGARQAPQKAPSQAPAPAPAASNTTTLPSRLAPVPPEDTTTPQPSPSVPVGRPQPQVTVPAAPGTPPAPSPPAAPPTLLPTHVEAEVPVVGKVRVGL